MIKSKRRGSVLIHVLITGVIVAFIAAGMLRMVMMNYIAVDRAGKGAANRKEADALLNRALTYWNEANQVCAPVPGLACAPGPSPSPGICSCTCTGTPAPGSTVSPTIVVSGGGAPPCTITIGTSDPQ